MSVFKRARGYCPKCGRDIRKNVTESKSKQVLVVCCGLENKIEIGRDWWVAFREPSGKTKTILVGPDRQAALRIDDKLKVEINENRYTDRKEQCTTTLTSLVEQYGKAIEPIRSRKGYKRDMGMLNQAVACMGGGTIISRIDEGMVEDYRLTMTKDEKKPGTVALHLATFRAMLSWAVKRKLIDKRPMISIPNPHNERVRFIGKDEALALLECCKQVSPTLADLVSAALFTGMRVGELLAMPWDWVDLQLGLINIPATNTKTKRSRSIPISADMAAMLERRKALAVEKLPVLHDRGKGLTRNWLQPLWKEAREKAKITDLHFHDLRHCCASWMIQAGVDLYSASQVLGHRSLAMTARYSHLAPHHLKSAIAKTNLFTVEEPPKEPPKEQPEVKGSVNPEDNDCQELAEVIPFQQVQAVRG